MIDTVVADRFLVFGKTGHHAIVQIRCSSIAPYGISDDSLSDVYDTVGYRYKIFIGDGPAGVGPAPPVETLYECRKNAVIKARELIRELERKECLAEKGCIPVALVTCAVCNDDFHPGTSDSFVIQCGNVRAQICGEDCFLELARATKNRLQLASKNEDNNLHAEDILAEYVGFLDGDSNE